MRRAPQCHRETPCDDRRHAGGTRRSGRCSSSTATATGADEPDPLRAVRKASAAHACQLISELAAAAHSGRQLIRELIWLR